jgi:hypothetical protein
MESWINFSTMLIFDRSEDPKWIQNGTQQNYDDDVLSAIVVALGHVKFIPIAIEKGILSAIAQFSKVRKPPNMPDDETAETICAIFTNAYRCCSVIYEQ